MRNVLFALISLLSLSSYAQRENITGNGSLKRETREIIGFEGISVMGSVNVELAYGNEGSLTVEGDENLLPYIETYVEDGNLVIKTRDKIGLKSTKKMVVYAKATRLSSLRVMGSGNINGAGDFTNDNRTEIAVTGSGNINIAINSFSETKISVTGSGNVTLRGNSTNNIDAKISGSGNIDCSELSCNDVFANVSGSGNIKVYANKSIDAKVSGSGNIYYKGSAKNINLKSSGSGKIIRA